MPKTVKIICDACGETIETSELNITRSRYHLVLAVRATSAGHTIQELVTLSSVKVPPPLYRDYYFCNKDCVRRWLEKEAESDKATKNTALGSTATIDPLSTKTIGF